MAVVAIGIVWMQSATSAYCSTNEDHVLFSSIANSQLASAEQATVQGLTLIHQDIEFHFEDGVIFRLVPVEGKITGFYFSGKGWATFTPSDSGEARQLDRMTGEAGGSEKRPFDRLYCRFPDWKYLSFSRTPVFVPILSKIVIKFSVLPCIRAGALLQKSRPRRTHRSVLSSRTDLSESLSGKIYRS